MTIHITPSAQKQIVVAAEQSQAHGLPLRIAIARTSDGTVDYRMGFDDAGIKEADNQYQVGDIMVVVSAEDKPLLEGIQLDYVEFEPGQFHFIFYNPNDPSHSKAKHV